MSVSLVIPGRNCGATLRPCLASVVPLLETEPGLDEIIFVDDGSTDDSAAIAGEFPVRCLSGPGRGPGAARNLGWRAARAPLVWFVDSDCVAEPGALERLLPHLETPGVAGVSGSYGNLVPESLLACLIHEEIVERHRRMPTKVNFLATFNVLYRRSVLEAVGGFDERYLKGQDAELAFRVLEAGHELHFELASRVGHHHERRWLRYLRTQRQQGFWRVRLHHEHRGHARGDAYSSVVDHAQPALAVLLLASLPLVLVPGGAWVVAGLLVPTAAAPLPMTGRLLRRLRRARYAAFWWMSFLRGFWRGVGLVHGVLALPFTGPRRADPS
ncbi:MAG: glycosyltransferase family 2 protein [Planctomycetota bacterium]|jgi:glycosyltransferase involved in cell wall biosynthesis